MVNRSNGDYTHSGGLLMRRYTVAVTVALAFAVGTALASETPRGEPQPGVPNKAAVCERLKSSGANPRRLAQEGCCSTQGGVCGCEYGQILCCNGQYDAVCEC